MKFKSDIEVQAGLKDSSGALGASGQILSSTNGNVSWINQTTIANDVQNLVKAGVAINKGQAVYVTGADGTNIIVGLASNTAEATSSKTIGLLNATVAINGFADVVQIGRLAGLNTLGSTAGDPVWLGTNGNLIYGLINKPYAPANLVFIGVVTRVNVNNGEIFINVQNGFELNELHDVDLKTTVAINGDILGYNGTLWVNKTIAGWLGYTPANASGTTNYVSKFTGTTTLGDSQIFDNGTKVGVGTTSFVGSIKLAVNGLIGGPTYSSNFVDFTNAVTELRGNSGIGYYAASGNHIFYGPSSGEKVRITDTGNVGIGTSSPGIKLQVETNVNGSDGIWARNTNTGASSYGVVIANSAVGGIGLRAHSAANGAWPNTSMLHSASGFSNGLVLFQEGANPIAFWTNTNERMRITSGGNVGIGTNAPATLLDVNGVGTFMAYSTPTLLTKISGNYGQVITMARNGAGNNVGLGVADSGQLAFYTNNVETNRINSNGNFLINTTTDNGGKLQIKAPGALSTDIALRVRNSADSLNLMFVNGLAQTAIGQGTATLTNMLTVQDVLSTSVGIELRSDQNPRVGSTFNTSRILSGYSSSTESFLDLQYAGGAYPYTYTTGLRLNSLGNVGIGTTAPLTELHVVSSGDTEIRASENTNNNYISLYQQAANSYLIAAGPSSCPLMIYTGASERMRITGAGNVGIGTSSPIYKLDVVGGISTTTNSLIAGTFSFINLENNSSKLNCSRFLAIQETGSVGIGYNSDGVPISAKFLVNGTSYFNSTIFTNGNVLVGTTTNNGGRLQIKAPGALSTDIALRVRNSADSGDLMTVNGLGNVTLGAGGYIYGDTTTPFLRLSQTNGSFLGYGNSGVGLFGTLADIYSTDRITFQTNSSERMRINSTGNVGIGTTIPPERLSVSTTDEYLTSWQRTGISKRWAFGADTGGTYFSNRTDSVLPLYITNTGNVGIGTTAPATKLEVGGSVFGEFEALRLVNTANVAPNRGTSQTFYIPALTGSNEIGGKLLISRSSDNNGSYMAFSTTTTNAAGVTEKMRVTSTGNVGIGETVPTAKLHIKAPGALSTDIALRVRNSADSGDLFQVQGNGAIVLSSGASFYTLGNNLNFRANLLGGAGYVLDVQSFYSLNSPNNEQGLGMFAGTFAPTSGTAAFNGLKITATINQTGGANGITRGLFINPTLTAAADFRAIETTVGNVILGSTSGNVGIGTTSPIYKLDVNGTSNINGAFYVSGNVGIGTTMPTTKVDIVDTMTNPTLRLAYVPMSGYGGGGNIDFVGGSTDYVSGAISWKNGMTVQGQVDYNGVGRTMTLTAQSTIVFKTTIMERMRIDSTGQVGIGTSSPMYTLHVNGSVAGTSAYVNLSDERYKKDILPIENALDKVLSLNGVTFNWNKEFNPGTKLDDANHIGLIAQEVEKVIPQAVSTGKDGNKTKSVAYTDLVPVLIEAIKELKLEIEELKKLINK